MCLLVIYVDNSGSEDSDESDPNDEGTKQSDVASSSEEEESDDDDVEDGNEEEELSISALIERAQQKAQRKTKV